MEMYYPDRGRKSTRTCDVPHLLASLEMYYPDRGRKFYLDESVAFNLVVWKCITPIGDGKLSTLIFKKIKNIVWKCITPIGDGKDED